MLAADCKAVFSCANNLNNQSENPTMLCSFNACDIMMSKIDEAACKYSRPLANTH